MRLRILGCVSAAAAVLVSSAALAASGTGTYKGKTSQHFALSLTLSHKSSRLYGGLTTKLTYKCPSGSMTQPAGFSGILIKHHGKTYSAFAGGGPNGYDSHYSWQIHGTKLSGSVRASFEVSSGKCSTGKVTFTAQR